MSWIDAVLSEFTRVTLQQWLMTIIGGIGLAWLSSNHEAACCCRGE